MHSLLTAGWARNITVLYHAGGRLSNTFQALCAPAALGVNAPMRPFAIKPTKILRRFLRLARLKKRATAPHAAAFCNHFQMPPAGAAFGMPAAQGFIGTMSSFSFLAMYKAIWPHSGMAFPFCLLPFCLRPSIKRTSVISKITAGIFRKKHSIFAIIFRF